ncbi:MAG: alpha/beta hydrolase [Idiomarina sp.]|nr:alpha/beta hydrolase [Idiomarina sp.]
MRPILALSSSILSFCSAVLFIAFTAVVSGPAAHAQVSVSFQDVLDLPTREPDQRITYGSAEPQFAELWLPLQYTESEVEHRAPVVVFIHGGCWLNSFNVGHTHGLMTALTEAGFAAWNIEYRRLDDEGGGWPGSLEDVQQALETLFALDHPAIDTERVVVAGHSAGGHLALLATRHEEERVRHVIGLAAITDLARYAAGESGCEQAAARLQAMAGHDREAIRSMNPRGQSLHPQITLFQGESDFIVRPEQAELPGANQRLIERAGHFDMIHPSTPTGQELFQLLKQELML